MLRKLRIKFVCIVMAIVTIMLSTVFGMVIHYMSKSLEEQSIRTLPIQPSSATWGTFPKKFGFPILRCSSDFGGS